MLTFSIISHAPRLTKVLNLRRQKKKTASLFKLRKFKTPTNSLFPSPCNPPNVNFATEGVLLAVHYDMYVTFSFELSNIIYFLLPPEYVSGPTPNCVGDVAFSFSRQSRLNLATQTFPSTSLLVVHYGVYVTFSFAFLILFISSSPRLHGRANPKVSHRPLLFITCPLRLTVFFLIRIPRLLSALSFFRALRLCHVIAVCGSEFCMTYTNFTGRSPGAYMPLEVPWNTQGFQLGSKNPRYEGLLRTFRGFGALSLLESFTLGDCLAVLLGKNPRLTSVPLNACPWVFPPFPLV